MRGSSVYARPDAYACDTPTLTIGQALKAARERAFAADPTSSSWGAYQHYGNADDRLVACEDVPSARAPTPPAGDLASFTVVVSDAPPPPLSAGNPPMTEIRQTAATQTAAPQPGKELVYVNGIDFDTGQYAVQPQPIDEIAKRVFQRPELDKFSDVHAEHDRSSEYRSASTWTNPCRPDGASYSTLIRRRTSARRSRHWSRIGASRSAIWSRSSTTLRTSRRATGIGDTASRPARSIRRSSPTTCCWSVGPS